MEIRAALPDYVNVMGEEIIDRSVFLDAGGNPDAVYHVEGERVLRRETTITLLNAMKGRTPPVRLLTAGRVFRPDGEEDATHVKAFHQFDLLCVDAGLTVDSVAPTAGAQT